MEKMLIKDMVVALVEQGNVVVETTENEFPKELRIYKYKENILVEQKNNNPADDEPDVWVASGISPDSIIDYIMNKEIQVIPYVINDYIDSNTDVTE